MINAESRVKIIDTYSESYNQIHAQFCKDVDREREDRNIKATNIFKTKITTDEGTGSKDEKSLRESGYSDVKDTFVQQKEQIWDRYGNRWVKCRICGKIKTVDEFWEYGGPDRMNLGRCYECVKR